MLRFLYSLFFRIALPVVLLKLWWSSRDNPLAWRGWQERVGFVRSSTQPVIWVHAVSVGETIAAGPLVKSLLRRNVGAPILMTAMTLTGQARAKTMFGDQVGYAYAPYDTPGAVRRFIKRARPQALVIMETEIWPNMIFLCRQQRIPIFLINARLSERSAKGYERVGSLAKPLLQSICWIAAQADDDADRFLRIGAKLESVSVTGSIKFDVDLTDEVRVQAAALRKRFGERPVWIAASTHEGEDEQLLSAHKQILERHPEALLIIVPRHPERFDSVARLTQKLGLSLKQRSKVSESDSLSSCQVYQGDTMGELLMLYGASDIAFVGGSLIERGGHNPLEPAAWGLPVLSGPHVFNFETIYRSLHAGGAVSFTGSASELANQVCQWLEQPDELKRVGRNAQQVVDANRGVLEKVVEGVLNRIS